MLDQRFPASVHIMTLLAYHHGERMTSDYLAKSIRTNPTVVRRLLSKLVEAKLVNSFKGKAGGVKIARNAGEITLKDIYVAVSDKKLMCLSDKEPQRHCAVSCAMKKLMNDVTEGVEEQSLQYLAKIRLSSLLAKI